MGSAQNSRSRVRARGEEIPNTVLGLRMVMSFVGWRGILCSFGTWSSVGREHYILMTGALMPCSFDSVCNLP